MKTLSIRNPWAYLIAFGIKDVENRSWKTNYRGELLIHASGDPWAWLNLEYLPNGFCEQVNQVMDEEIPYDHLDYHLRRYSDLITYFCDHLCIDYDIPQDRFESILKSSIKTHGFPMHSQVVIGKANLVDIVENSPSVWAEEYKYHWVLKHAELFDTPFWGVKGKLRLWDFDINNIV